MRPHPTSALSQLFTYADGDLAIFNPTLVMAGDAHLGIRLDFADLP
jgi:hypothetical protein